MRFFMCTVEYGANEGIYSVQAATAAYLPEPTTPTIGLLALAYSRFSIRPASKANRPA
jgi:hypothetical protein